MQHESCLARLTRARAPYHARSCAHPLAASARCGRAFIGQVARNVGTVLAGTLAVQAAARAAPPGLPHLSQLDASERAFQARALPAHTKCTCALQLDMATAA